MKRYLVLALTLVLLVGLSLPAKGASDKPKSGGTLTMAIRKDVSIMNPMIRTSSTDQSIRELIYESLLALDERGAIKPKLAESWEISNDGKVYTFHLRKGVKFHNGKEVIAEDAKYAMDYTLNPKNGAYGRSRLTLVEGVKAPDKYTLKVYLKDRSSAFLSILTNIKAFSFIPKGSLKSAKPSEFPPGSGPFRFVEWKANQRIVFERYENYWGPKPYLDKVILRPIRNATVRFTALRVGDVDIIERTPYEWVNQITAGKIKGVKIIKSANAGYRSVFFNVVDPPFNNKKLRLAVAHAIDKKNILQAAYFGFGGIADQKYPKGHTWYVEGIPSPSYDPAKAKKLLMEAAYDGATIVMNVQKGDVPEAMATVLQAQLKRVGVNIRLQIFEFGAYRDRVRKGETTFNLTGGGYFADPIPTYRSSLECEPDPRKRASNWSGYCDKEVEGLFEKLDTELDHNKRQKTLAKIIAKVNQDVPILTIGFVPRFFTLRDHVKGFTTDDDGARFVWGGGGLTRTWLDK